jgi:hypothetical protein
MWPFVKWVDTEEREWITVATAGEYDHKQLARRQVRTSDGVTRWHVKQYFPFGPIECWEKREKP